MDKCNISPTETSEKSANFKKDGFSGIPFCKLMDKIRRSPVDMVNICKYPPLFTGFHTSQVVLGFHVTTGVAILRKKRMASGPGGAKSTWLPVRKATSKKGETLRECFFSSKVFCATITLHGIKISHLGKRKTIFKIDFSSDMLVPRRVDFSAFVWDFWSFFKLDWNFPFYSKTKMGKIPIVFFSQQFTKLDFLIGKHFSFLAKFWDICFFVWQLFVAKAGTVEKWIWLEPGIPGVKLRCENNTCSYPE